MPDSNPFTIASERLADRMAASEKEASKSKAMPFGMERVTADMEARAFQAMNREDRLKFMEAHATKDDPQAVQYVLKVLRRGGDHAI